MEEFLTKVAALGRMQEPGLGKVLSSSVLQHTTASHFSTPAQAWLVCKHLASQETLLSLGQAIFAQGHRRTRGGDAPAALAACSPGMGVFSMICCT